MARGFRALSRGKFDEASTCCKLVLERQPQLAPAHFLVGLIALATTDLNTARAAFATVTRIEPGHAAAWAHLAKLLAEGGQVNRADLALENAVQHEAGDIPQVLDVIGTTYTLLGEHQLADEWFRRAAESQPDNPALRINYANNLIYLGQTALAKRELAAALQLGRGHAQAHWLVASLAKALDHGHLGEMQALLAARPLPQRAQAFLHYAMGKEYEDLEEWESAFDSFARGARARRATLQFDEQLEEETFAALGELYTSQWLANQGPGNDDPSPIFIIGQPRTGTTLVERIVTAHSAVHSAGELQQFGNCIRRLTRYDRVFPLSCSIGRERSTQRCWAVSTCCVPPACGVRCPVLWTSCPITTCSSHKYSQHCPMRASSTWCATLGTPVSRSSSSCSPMPTRTPTILKKWPAISRVTSA
jgi:tetratricopeptide (TPR) repeat protein